jgi:acyl carrier protein
MSTVNDEVRSKVKELVCDILELEPDELSDTSLFVEDHGADSLRAIEILASLEVTFRTTIDQSELERMTTLSGIYEVLGDAIGARA